MTGLGPTVFSISICPLIVDHVRDHWMFFLISETLPDAETGPDVADFPAITPDVCMQYHVQYDSYVSM